ncbi:MAG TPA: aminopeptidase P N-terminal domain-containing protein [Flavisolibacter sp.]|jgi:Xaa-Pro aminopeptidase|nr:aminopeptidase P N-terminal domain-containing protein [Flavisolibacter sp.]
MQLYFFQRCLIAAVFSCASFTAFAQEDVPTDYLSKEFHKGRRDAARALMPDSSVMVIFAAPTRTFANDVDYLYHQNPDLYYFTGYKEPHAVLFLFKQAQKGSDGAEYNELFFVQKKDARSEQWTGRRLGATGAREKSGIQTVYAGDDFKGFSVDFTSITKIIMDNLPDDLKKGRNGGDLYNLIQEFKTKASITEVKDRRVDARAFRDITGQLREIKTPEEMYLIRKAVEISCAGQNEVMKTLRPDMSELEIQGLHEYVHKKYGSEEVGYGSIVGAGENGCILHYMENSKTKIGNNLLLMDVGAAYHGYTSDVTRTVPAKGKFSAEEKIIYQLVYDAQEAAFRLLKDGAKWSDAGAAAKEVIASGLLSLGIIKDKKDVSKYYPHGLSHHIGLDVHDKGVSPVLKKDMVITIEPGIYIQPNSDCDKKWWSIAVRIEDDALITENGYELLSHFAPRSADAIEKLMAEKSVLDNYKLPALKTAKSKPAF